MFVCCMFLELGLGVVWNLNGLGTLLESSVLEFWFKCFGILCTSLFFCVPCGCLMCLSCYSWYCFVVFSGWAGNSRSIWPSFKLRKPVLQNWKVVLRQCKWVQLHLQTRRLCAVEFRQSGTRCAFICGLIAVCCTKRIVSIFKGLELKNSTYVRYACSVDDRTLGVFLGKRPAQRSATTCIGLITKGLEDNTTEELLEPGSSEAKIPNLKNV